jgi:FkbM family methyltransferase
MSRMVCTPSREVSFVQIGAHCGEEALPHAEKGVRCLLVEPVPCLYQRLRQRFAGFPNVTVVSDIVAGRRKKTELYYLADTSGLPYWADQIASLSRNHILELGLQEHWPKHFQDRIVCERKVAVTLNDLLERFNMQCIGTLLVDAEGCDAQILMSVNFNAVDIAEIVFERKHTDGVRVTGYKYNEVVSRLEYHGYDVRKLNAQNDIAILADNWRERRQTSQSRDSDFTGLRIQNPTLPVTIFTDYPQHPDLPAFADIRPVPSHSSPFKLKVAIMRQSPYAQTLFLDADTYVFGSVEALFALLDYNDLAVARAPLFHYRDGELVFDAFEASHFNTGVLAYAQNSALAGMLECWEHSMAGQDDSGISAGIMCDQHYFNSVVIKGPVFAQLKTHVLDNRVWNLRCYALGPAVQEGFFKDTVIVHGKSWEAMRFWDIDLSALCIERL